MNATPSNSTSIPGNISLQLGNYQRHVDCRLKQLQDLNFAERLWNKDQSLWTEKFSGTESSEILMGWLDLVEKMEKVLPEIEKFSEEIRQQSFEHIVLLGMGGSSLAPFVFQKIFDAPAKQPKLIVLDTTDPKTILKTANEINIFRTLFIVSSKSGSTAEVRALYSYFYERLFLMKREKAADNFIAITDEGSPLAKLAAQKKFRKTFINFSDVGGRFSALSYFGLVPAALIGINVKELLQRTQTMVEACGPRIPLAQNPGIVLGTAIAELALRNCDKLTYLLPPELEAFGCWLEQLVAESTGKNGKGILPLKGDLLSAVNPGKDRFFIEFVISNYPHTVNSAELPEKNETEKIPFITIQVDHALDLGAEFFRWEIAVATAGAILGVNPFDQPNVEDSKKCTDLFLKKLIDKGKLPEIKPSLIENDLHYYAERKSPRGKLLMTDFFSTVQPGDYITLQAYLPEETEVVQQVAEIQSLLQNALGLAVSYQFGPRYLHSTGQYHKGGPNNGYFIQLIGHTGADPKVPGQPYTFSVFKKAQATGDLQALKKLNRKVMQIEIISDLVTGLKSFKQVLERTYPSAKELFAEPVEKNNYPDKAAISENAIRKLTFLF